MFLFEQNHNTTKTADGKTSMLIEKLEVITE